MKESDIVLFNRNLGTIPAETKSIINQEKVSIILEWERHDMKTVCSYISEWRVS